MLLLQCIVVQSPVSFVWQWGVGKLRYGGEVNEILGHGDWGAMRVARTRYSSGGEVKVGLGTEGGVVK